MHVERGVKIWAKNSVFFMVLCMLTGGGQNMGFFVPRTFAEFDQKYRKLPLGFNVENMKVKTRMTIIKM